MEGVLTRKIGWGQLLPFALLYGLAAVTIAQMNWRRYSPDEHGWTLGITMALFVSLVFAAGSTMLGEAWIWMEHGSLLDDHIQVSCLLERPVVELR